MLFKYIVDVFLNRDELDYIYNRSLSEMYSRTTVCEDLFSGYQLTCSHPDFCNLVVL